MPTLSHPDPFHDYVDLEVAAFYEEPTDRRRSEEAPWHRERRGLRRAVILSAPSSGKSFLTNTTAVELASAARATLRSGHARPETLDLPIHLTLARLAAPALPRDNLQAPERGHSCPPHRPFVAAVWTKPNPADIRSLLRTRMSALRSLRLARAEEYLGVMHPGKAPVWLRPWAGWAALWYRKSFSILQTGVRWFPEGRGSFRIMTVEELSAT